MELLRGMLSLFRVMIRVELRSSVACNGDTSDCGFLPIFLPGWIPEAGHGSQDPWWGRVSVRPFRAETSSFLGWSRGFGSSSESRRADIAFGTPAFGRIAARSGVDGRLLAWTALAWRYGGQTGFETFTSGWNPQEEQPDATDLLKGAVTALRGATGEQAYVVANKVTVGRVHVRLGRDLLWYPYLSSDEDWEPAGPPHADPVRAIEVAGLAAVDR
jgi:hypothetical protein